MAQLVSAGSVLGGRYQLENKLGEGGMGEVWQAIHLTLGSRVAIKALHPFLIRHEGTRARFLNEARVMAQLSTRRAVRVFDFGITDEGVPFLVMELVDGETLGHKRARQGKLHHGTTARLLGQAARGLERAHALGIVHRDLKPDNILLTLDEDGDLQVKVTDFGVATLLDSGDERSSGRSATVRTTGAGLFGTPVYMAPEQINGEASTTAVDIWAFGVLAYECLTGRLPFLAQDIDTLRTRITGRSHVPATSLSQGIPRAFDDWFERACATRPQDRYPTIRTAAIALTLALEVEDDGLDRSLAIGAHRSRGSIRALPAAAMSADIPRTLTPPPAQSIVPSRPSSPALPRALFAVGMASLVLSIGVTVRSRIALNSVLSATSPTSSVAASLAAVTPLDMGPSVISPAAPATSVSPTIECVIDPRGMRPDASVLGPCIDTAQPTRATHTDHGDPRPRSTSRSALPQYRDFPDSRPEPAAPVDPSFKRDPYSRK